MLALRRTGLLPDVMASAIWVSLTLTRFKATRAAIAPATCGAAYTQLSAGSRDDGAIL